MVNQKIVNSIALGEDSERQFKSDVRNAESLAAEMAAFANSEGGTIYLGVADDGSIPGLDQADVARINQIISNAASQLVKSPLAVKTKNFALDNGRILIVLSVPKGLDKPYFDKNGVIWLKTGSDKRRINSKEELRRLFQVTDQFYADELPTKAKIDDLDKLRFRDFLREVHEKEYPDDQTELMRLLQNMNLVTDDEKLNLAGLLMFTEQPELFKPQFVLKAIRYPGNKIHVTDYIDTEEFAGPLPEILAGDITFIMRKLHKVQAGRGVNSPVVPEISEVLFEELLVNALVHRDYLVSAPIRLFIFDNRIEIINPGHLPNNLTVDKIRAGNSNIRNPILVSYAAKGLLPYHGLGSGIKRALSAWPQIDFVDDREGCLFKATVHRKSIDELALIKNVANGSIDTAKVSGKRPKSVGKELKASGKRAKNVGKELKKCQERAGSVGKESRKRRVRTEKTTDKILNMCRERPSITISELAEVIGVTERTIQRNIQKLQADQLLIRSGGRKTGFWEVVE